MAFPPEQDCTNWTLKDWLIGKKRVLLEQDKARKYFPKFFELYGKSENVYLLKNHLYKNGDDILNFYGIDFDKNTLFFAVIDTRKKIEKLTIVNEYDISHLKTGKDYDEYIHNPAITFFLTVGTENWEKIEL